jgi:uncharacterized membrane protein
MNKNRLEAFSDGVIAVIITVMVLDIKIPAGTGWEAVRSLIPRIFTYLLSFVYVGIYWNNHHHMLHMTKRINGKILWANLHLLFWLSLVPLATGWKTEDPFSHAPVPSAVYGFILLWCGIAYYILQSCIIADQGEGSPLKAAIGKDLKGKVSPLLYATAIGISFLHEPTAFATYVGIALLWLVPDKRIESRFRE